MTKAAQNVKGIGLVSLTRLKKLEAINLTVFPVGAHLLFS